MKKTASLPAQKIMHDFKQHIITACHHHLKDKIASLQNMLHDIAEATNAETKSTAGDKHETGRAMMQLEREKLGKQLQEAEIQLTEFLKTDFTKTVSLVGQGSLVETDKGWFFIAVAIGKITVAEKTGFVISAASPLGNVLTGSKQKDTVVFNSVSYHILNLY